MCCYSAKGKIKKNVDYFEGNAIIELTNDDMDEKIYAEYGCSPLC